MSSTNILSSWFPHTTTPFIASGPMFFVTTASLVAAVSDAGGFGFLAGCYDCSPASGQIRALSAELTNARTLLKIQDPKAPVPVGIGFITVNTDGFLENAMPVIAAHRPAAIWLFAPKSRAQHASLIPALKTAGAEWNLKVFVQVGTVAAAREAVEDGVDALVVQGVDAGGHQWAQGAGIVSLVPEVKDMLVREFAGKEIPILAAGGIMDGRGVAAALVLGADGIVMGTRFIATEETATPAAMKERYVASSDGGVSTIKSTVHDDIQGTGFWPSVYNGRAIIGASYQDFVNGVSIEDNIAKHNNAGEGDLSRKILWAGSGVGLIRSVLSTKDVVIQSQKEAKEILGRINRVLL
ncbi:inosine monophosphate dehydrogenase [Athelia psychrophila]|uniref:Inosine monophosphate dehydrogenase n=1 Tax=Athelia psychrophila TaxID=1759441 RepID=A0A166SQG3_9AGAM|nr:inosine monophosphate dehydrogenase [Fibularhizoctonia sp. CBS 109695]